MAQLIPRKSDRRRFLVEVDVRCVGQGNAFKAHAIDLGESGISLFSKRFLQAGQAIELEFKGGRSAHSCKALGSIAYARVESDGNILGVEFARPLSPQEMQALGIPAGKLSN